MAELLAFPSAIPDAVARERALDTTRSFVVEAPAGSGKTGLLIQRYLKLLASPSITDPAQILAITFTRKATHEMRDRVLAQLAAAASGIGPANSFDIATRPFADAALARDRQLNWNLLSHPNRLNITTIDALCAQIARSLPVLSGAPAQSPVEDSSELYAQAARQTIALLGGPDPHVHAALELLLLHRDANLPDCEKLIASMLNSREQWANLIPLSGDQLTDEFLETVTLPRIEKALDQAICRALTHLGHIFPNDLCQQLSSLARSMSHSPGYNGDENPLTICRDLPLHPDTAAEGIDHWKLLARLLVTKDEKWRTGFNKNHMAFEIEKHHKAELKALIERLGNEPGLREALCNLTNLPPIHYPPEQWVVAKALFRVLSRALIELQLVFAARGECDFTEFAILARTALAQTSALDDLTASIGFRLEHLLVDEMQDTSNSQYELIRLLTQHWDGHSQTVFLVGDPKQSIYLFRQARVERFLQTLATHSLGDLPLTPLQLTANFRSQAHLVHSFNQTFAAIFPSPQRSYDMIDKLRHPERSEGPLYFDQHNLQKNPSSIHYLPAHPTRPRTYGSDLLWHPTPLPYDPANKAELRRLQIHQNATEIAEIVSAWRSRPLPPDRTKPWQTAVLVRNRRHLLQIVRAFKEDGIPYKAIKTEPLAERQEVLDLLALTRALLHPADRTAWLALLRSPLCGLTLADLHLLAGADNPEYNERTLLELIESRGDLLSEDALERLSPFWSIMTAALAQRTRLPLSQLVERTWRAFGAAACASESEMENGQQFFALLDDLESAPEPITIGRLLNKIDGLYAAPSTAPDAVELMTIHNSKGLEWDVVIVPELESGSGKNSSHLLSWIEIEGAGSDPATAHGIIAPVQSRGQETQALNKWMRSIESAREAEERKRLFYVACTRASEELHLFAAPALTSKGDLNPAYDSLLRAAWPAAEPIFTNQPEQPEPAILKQIAAAALTLVPPPQPRTIQRIPNSSVNVRHPERSEGPLYLAGPTDNDRVPHPYDSSTVVRVGIDEPGAPRLDSKTWDRPSQTSTRPSGTLAARAFGTTLHTLIETLTHRLASGNKPESLIAELPTWTPRITALLASFGTPTADRAAATTAILQALTRTLADPIGRWLLAPHPESQTEHSLASQAGQIRLDRTFLAGPTPLSTGQTHLWIIDYKTSTPPPNTNPATFLAEEKSLYAPQLSAYAAYLTSRDLPIHLALYHPTLTTLTWWPDDSKLENSEL